MSVILVAPATADTATDTDPEVITGSAVCFRRTRVVVVELSLPPGPAAAELASKSLVDAQPVPVLVGAGR